ncbi:hypothetical protein CMV_006606 [Castanea mollissima]|uniref:Uncharacterized protein n=1 Tax=Castanea mollissima TaxID=60419 RepID=A0A8J4VTF5_9ROSI|nr:hypothetical protein CMV_006606 [Castanea mollissima]
MNPPLRRTHLSNPPLREIEPSRLRREIKPSPLRSEIEPNRTGHAERHYVIPRVSNGTTSSHTKGSQAEIQVVSASK